MPGMSMAASASHYARNSIEFLCGPSSALGSSLAAPKPTYGKRS
jgi:hypothetical protein